MRCSKTSVQLAAGVLLVVGLHAPGQHWRQRQLTAVRDDLPATLLHLPALGEPGASAALWLPAPLFAGLATFCFAAMSNALNLTDGLDGLAAGTAAIAYTGMALAVLPISPGEAAHHAQATRQGRMAHGPRAAMQELPAWSPTVFLVPGGRPTTTGLT